VWDTRQFSTAVVECPDLGDSISEGTLIEWHKTIGDQVNVDDPVCDIETDKVSVTINSTASGALTAYNVEEGDTVEVGQGLFTIDTAATGSTSEAPAAAETPAETPVAQPKDAVAPPKPKPAAPVPTPAAVDQAAVSSGPSRGERHVKMTRMRQTIARRLKESQNTAALLTTFNEVDMSALMAMRTQHKDEFLAKHGCKLGFMSMFSKASASALMAYPDANALFDLENKEIVYRDYVDISVAVSTPTGLVTPVLRNVESMSFHDVEGSIAALGKKARDGKITIEDLTGGTFTISNGGVFGSLMGTPILNPPQAAILGMHGIFKRPVAVGNTVEIRPMMYVALTYDHRIIDGGTAVQTLKHIKECVEDPTRLLLEL
jgi:2-oxoglutarate dehydrogenase E2 component (dihydrolipoamide succinyltransferase)